MLVLSAGAWGGSIVNGSFETELADLDLAQTITGWSVAGASSYVCVAQSGTPYSCGASPAVTYPSTLADGPRAYRVGANGDFPRDPNNPDNETNSIYEATWADIVGLGYNYLFQSVTTAPGAIYTLTFQLQALHVEQPYYGFWVVVNQTPVANLSARTQANPVLRTDTSNQWATFQIPFIGTGLPMEVGFASFVECNNSGCDMDLFLDDVVLTEQLVPEPASFLLLGTALPLLWLIRRRRS